MTWREFKDHIDQRVNEDQEIWYIDVSFPEIGSIMVTGEVNEAAAIYT